MNTPEEQQAPQRTAGQEPHARQTGFRFKRVVIIESIATGELHTGRRLHEDCLQDFEYSVAGFESQLHEVNTRQEVFDVLARIENELSPPWGDDISLPIIHFETHGNTSGLGLADNSFLTYDELFPILSRINQHMRNNLLVVMSACCGAHLVRIIQHNFNPPLPAAFWAVCGPSVVVYPDDLLRAFTAFYTELLTSRDLNAALNALKNAYPDEAEHFHIQASEFFFKFAFYNYLREQCSSAQVDHRVEKRILELRELPGIIFDETKLTNEMRNRILSEEFQRREFERIRDDFFMYKPCPENRERFPMQLEDVHALDRIFKENDFDIRSGGER